MKHVSPRIVAVIPARGGSKGVPGKNLRPVGGVPLVARSVRAMLAAELVDAVYVSTDDPHIAATARHEGAQVIDRPAELADDAASSESALLHALDSIHPPADVLVFVQPTSPFIDPADVDQAIARVREGECDVVFSAVPSHAFLWRMGDEGADGVNHDPGTRPRRQDRAAEYRETGAFYVMDARGFRNRGHRFFGRVGIQQVPELGSGEIDTLDDLALASAVAPLVARARGYDVAAAESLAASPARNRVATPVN
jgi:N-acylneuraminate cytidylyltransferase